MIYKKAKKMNLDYDIATTTLRAFAGIDRIKIAVMFIEYGKLTFKHFIDCFGNEKKARYYLHTMHDFLRYKITKVEYIDPSLGNKAWYIDPQNKLAIEIATLLHRKFRSKVMSQIKRHKNLQEVQNNP